LCGPFWTGATAGAGWRWAAALSIAACLIPLRTTIGLAADDYRGRYEAREYADTDGAKLLYRLLKPQDYDPQVKYPLVLFLHGAGERGDDNTRQLVHGMNEFASDEIMAKYPCFVIAPQCPREQKWVEVDWSATGHGMPAAAAAPLRLTMEAIAALEKEFSIDPARIYVTGLSMGGYGTWDAIARYPERFAAAAPICGGGDPAQAPKFAQLPVWAFHGSKDGVVRPQRSREMIEAIKVAGGSPKYTEYPEAGHNSWTATYQNPEFFAWLFAQRRAGE
jgi:predicted peptidase